MSLINYTADLLFFYPLIGAMAWIIGGIFYRFFYNGRIKHYTRIAPEDEPMITILVPAHNEELMIEDTIDYLANEINYSNYEILVCDDGSTDTTPYILQRLMAKYDKLRVLRIEANKGKAHAFNVALGFAKGEFILSNDADTVPEKDALWKYMQHFLGKKYQNTGAVTANMDVQNRSLLVEKSQTVEFSSIVGIIKRAQMGVLGSMYAYSGANTMYRKSAVYDVGLWRQDRATEDISIAWDQQFNGWHAVFAPNIMFYMNVPNTIDMLYKQRKRWAKGGTEAWITNFKRILRHPLKNLPKTIMLLDQTGSIAWAFFYVIGTLITLAQFVYFILVGDFHEINKSTDVVFIFFSFMIFIGFCQLLVSLLLDNHRAKLKYIFFAPLYMAMYWQINIVSIITTFIPAIKAVMGMEGEGTWVSPERTKMRR
ncbi:glycosyltransferase family 2 protein [Lactococcus termiticola]|uniref:Glycosyltransferase n=1 Tax=Lactococcus termiticola TaxID=2169526 RepID=A0A2R5HI63_9LACT|nr:glycosyltransferase family 2 protein [Lactococcus termiticola]GBG97185.1 glycosyltransferase [Lactococcus termiticola]